MNKDKTDHTNSDIEMDPPSPPPLSCLGTSNIYNMEIGISVWDKSIHEDVVHKSPEHFYTENSEVGSEETKEIISPALSDNSCANAMDDEYGSNIPYKIDKMEIDRSNFNNDDSDDEFGKFEGTAFTAEEDLNKENDNDCSTSSDAHSEVSNLSGVIKFSKLYSNIEEDDSIVHSEDFKCKNNIEVDFTPSTKVDVSDDDFAKFATYTENNEEDFATFAKSDVEDSNEFSFNSSKVNHSTEIVNKDDDYTSDDDCEFGNFSTFESFETNITAADNENIQPNLSSLDSKYQTNSELSFKSECLPTLIEANDVTSHDSEVLNKLDNLISRWLGTTLKKESNSDVSLLSDYVEEDAFIWNHLVDVETSLALKLNWNNLSSKKNFLNSIDVDARNILYKNKWNTSIPIFAQTLSFSPLTPARCKENSEHSWSLDKVLTALNESPKPEPNSEGIIPPAKFDWSSSGLTNPLETPGIEKEILTPTMHEVKTDQSAIIQRLMDGHNTTNKSMPTTGMKPEVQKILSQLPDLNYMKAKVFMFPIT